MFFLGSFLSFFGKEEVQKALREKDYILSDNQEEYVKNLQLKEYHSPKKEYNVNQYLGKNYEVHESKIYSVRQNSNGTKELVLPEGDTSNVSVLVPVGGRADGYDDFALRGPTDASNNSDEITETDCTEILVHNMAALDYIAEDLRCHDDVRSLKEWEQDVVNSSAESSKNEIRGNKKSSKRQRSIGVENEASKRPRRRTVDDIWKDIKDDINDIHQIAMYPRFGTFGICGEVHYNRHFLEVN